MRDRVQGGVRDLHLHLHTGNAPVARRPFLSLSCTILVLVLSMHFMIDVISFLILL